VPRIFLLLLWVTSEKLVCMFSFHVDRVNKR
jgi:hypothetical protein